MTQRDGGNKGAGSGRSQKYGRTGRRGCLVKQNPLSKFISGRKPATMLTEDQAKRNRYGEKSSEKKKLYQRSIKERKLQRPEEVEGGDSFSLETVSYQGEREPGKKHRL